MVKLYAIFTDYHKLKIVKRCDKKHKFELAEATIKAIIDTFIWLELKRESHDPDRRCFVINKWFSDNWPADLKWPAGVLDKLENFPSCIKRPPPQKEAA